MDEALVAHELRLDAAHAAERDERVFARAHRWWDAVALPDPVSNDGCKDPHGEEAGSTDSRRNVPQNGMANFRRRGNLVNVVVVAVRVHTNGTATDWERETLVKRAEANGGCKRHAHR